MASGCWMDSIRDSKKDSNDRVSFFFFFFFSFFLGGGERNRVGGVGGMCNLGEHSDASFFFFFAWCTIS